MSTIAIGNTGLTTLTHVPYYIPGVACDSSGNVYTVHNYDEPHYDIIRWNPTTGANVWNSGYHSAPTLEWICVEPAGTFAYVIGYVGNPFDPTRTTTPGSGPLLTFGVYKYNLTSPGVPTTIVIPYNGVKIPFTSGSSVLDQGIEVMPLNAIALSGSVVYFTDSIGGKIYGYNTSSFAQTLNFSVTLPNGLAIDGSGNIWVGNGHTQVSVYSSSGTLLATPITGLTDVWSLAISGNTLYVLDQGSSVVQQYTLSGASATLVNTFGGPASPGQTSPLAFGLLRSIAADSSGNFIVSQFVANDNGSRLIKFNSSGVFQWESNCLEFASCLSYSLANPNIFISNSRHVYNANRGNKTVTWGGTGRTDYGSYWGLTQNASAGGKSRVVTLGGNDFFFYPGSSGPGGSIGGSGNLAIYRVVPTGSGAALQLCSCLALQQPGANGVLYGNTSFEYQWSWQDPTGNGMASMNAATVLGGANLITDKVPANLGSWAWYINSINVDSAGTIWIASYNRLFSGIHTYTEVWAIPLHGLTSSGNPIYHWADAINIIPTAKLLSDANITGSPTAAYIQTLDYDPLAKILYIALTDPNGATTGANSQSNTLLAYTGISGPSPITSSPSFVIKPTTYFSNVNVVPGRGYVWTQPTGLNNTGVVEQYDTAGTLLGSFVPPSSFISTPGEPTGSFDNFGSINSQIAPDGSLDIFAEDDFNGRVFWYNVPLIPTLSGIGLTVTVLNPTVLVGVFQTPSPMVTALLAPSPVVLVETPW